MRPNRCLRLMDGSPMIVELVRGRSNVVTAFLAAGILIEGGSEHAEWAGRRVETERESESEKMTSLHVIGLDL
jgi:hypothetical protein